MGCGASKITGDKKAFLDALRAKHHKDEAPDPDAAAKGCKFLRSGVSLKRIIEKNSVLVVVRVRPLSEKEIKTRDDLELPTETGVTRRMLRARRKLQAQGGTNNLDVSDCDISSASGLCVEVTDSAAPIVFANCRGPPVHECLELVR